MPTPVRRLSFPPTTPPKPGGRPLLISFSPAQRSIGEMILPRTNFPRDSSSSTCIVFLDLSSQSGAPTPNFPLMSSLDHDLFYQFLYVGDAASKVFPPFLSCQYFFFNPEPFPFLFFEFNQMVFDRPWISLHTTEVHSCPLFRQGPFFPQYGPGRGR